jgi:hypothetical protein
MTPEQTVWKARDKSHEDSSKEKKNKKWNRCDLRYEFLIHELGTFQDKLKMIS